MSNIVLNQHDLALYLNGDLDVFAVPAEQVKDLSSGEVGVLEQHYRMHATACNKKETSVLREIDGVRYLYDGETVWNISGEAWYGERPMPEPGEENVLVFRDERLKPAKRLPEYAIRHFIRVESVVQKPLQSFTKQDIRSMRLDYASTGDQQLLVNGYEGIKDYELLYAWWKARYKSTLRNTDNPLATIIRLAPPAE